MLVRLPAGPVLSYPQYSKHDIRRRYGDIRRRQEEVRGVSQISQSMGCSGEY